MIWCSGPWAGPLPAPLRPAGHHRRGALLLQGQRILPHLRDQERGGPGPHLPHPLHHGVSEEAAEVLRQGPGPERDVLPRHFTV